MSFQSVSPLKSRLLAATSAVALVAATAAWAAGTAGMLDASFGAGEEDGMPAGVALLAWDKANFKPDAAGKATGWAVLACLVACICYGISASYAKRYLMGIPPLVTATGSQLGATLGLALPALWFWPQHTPSLQAWLALLAVGVLCTGVAYILYFKLIETVGPARSLTVTFVAPVFALFYGRVFLAEAVSQWMVFCGVVIVCGTMLSTGLITFKKANK